ncbi:MAG: vWA domain-containing protein [Patescibacteria group bacterium]|jgi:Mg-chelatase subunit ChlD
MSRGELYIDGRGEAQLLLSDGKKIPLAQKRPAIGGGVVLLIDCSSSMRVGKIDEAKEGAVAFTKRVLPTGASVGVASFESTAELLVEPVRDFAVISAAVAAIEIGGSTNMADGITLANGILGEHNPRTIVLVTDGQPDDGEKALEAADNARIRDIDIICIGVDGADLEFLRLIATVQDMAMHVSAANLQKTLEASADMLLLKGK